MKTVRNIFLLFTIAIALVGCEKEVSFDMPAAEAKLVVEGWIDVGQPPIVLVSKSSGYYGTVDLNAISNLYLPDAVVMVSDGTDTITLQPLTLDTAGISVTVYTDPTLTIVGQVEKTYRLWVTHAQDFVSSVTTIPALHPLDSIWVEYDVKEDNPELVRLMVRYSDPPEIGQFVRYFTKANSEIMKPGRSSVFDDKLVNGTTFDFSLDKGYLQQDSIDFEEYGLFHKGDTITVKWSNIDKDHFDFWRTLEFELNQGGPYASPVKVQGNIVGGLGIWGGYNSSYKTLIVPE
jgi:hypothetical protein